MIQLRGLRVMGIHGALPEEQNRTQPFDVDVDIGADLSVAGRSDALADTVDYGAVTAAAQRIVAVEHHQLLERLAQRIADDVLSVDVRIVTVTVTVRKLRPPLAADLASVAVRITRP